MFGKAQVGKAAADGEDGQILNDFTNIIIIN